MFLLLDPELLEATRQKVNNGDPHLLPALERLCTEAEEALKQGPWSVMDKKFVPPSGDKHDFMSIAIYWWPNPDTPDGLPYIWKDGVQNPAYWESDGGSAKAMTDALETLGLAYYLTGDERYATHATRVLRTWFVDEATRMNPHLRYAQAIPGKCDGRSHGLVSIAQLFYKYPDFIALLRDSKAWTHADEAAMKGWFREFLDWTLTHEFGEESAVMRNNHGTFCNLMICTLALFTDQPEVAGRVLEAMPERIADQIEPDGKTPHELWRTRTFLYTTFNLHGLFELATLAESFHIDLWNYQTEDGRSIRKAIEWMAQYAHPDSQWPYPEMDMSTSRPMLYSMLHRASSIYNEPRYRQTVEALPETEWENQRYQLLWSAVELPVREK